jgi:hypothetical protein
MHEQSNWRGHLALVDGGGHAAESSHEAEGAAISQGGGVDRHPGDDASERAALQDLSRTVSAWVPALPVESRIRTAFLELQNYSGRILGPLSGPAPDPTGGDR